VYCALLGAITARKKPSDWAKKGWGERERERKSLKGRGKKRH